MKWQLPAGVMLLVLFMAPASFAVVVGGDDLDGGTTNGGFIPVSRVLNPDNTADNGQWPFGNERDYFGIGSIDINGDGSCADFGDCDLNPIIIDESNWNVPLDQAGIIPANETDNKFLIADLEGGHNDTSPTGTGTWTFDISGHSNLSIGIRMAHYGEFGQQVRATGTVSDSYNWSYQIDGGPVQTLFDVQAANGGMGDGAGYVATMADGNSYLAGDPLFFFNADANGWGGMNCEIGTADSCTQFTNSFGDIVSPAELDANRDGFIYLDVSASTISDTPSNPGELMEDAMMMYQEEDDFFNPGCTDGPTDCFQQAERDLFRNPTLVNGVEAINNQLREFVANVQGQGSELTLTFDAANYGTRYFVFDDIVINAADTPSGDFNNDTEWDCDDINALSAAIAASSTDLSFDMNGDGSVTLEDITDAGTGWLAVGGANNPDDTSGGNPFLIADSNLDGTVDGPDFLEWNTNKFSPSDAYCSGDFDASGFIDGADFLLWNTNKFQTADNVAAVPEPATCSLVLMAMLLGVLRRRR